MANQKKQTDKTSPGIIVNQIVVNRVNRQILDIGKWRTALKSADMDRMTLLYDLYEDILIDGRLWDAIDRRIRAVTGSDLTFQFQDGTESQELIDLIDTEEFEYLLYEIMQSAFWGVSLIQLDFSDTNMTVYSTPRKHIRPKNKSIAVMQNDVEGSISYEQLQNIIEVVNKKDPFGLILRAAPYVIMMRGGIGDWAQMVELFAMPQRVGKYSIYDQEARKQLEQAFAEQGAAASIVVPKETDVETVSGSTSVNSSIYKDFIAELKEALLVTVLSNTMTTLDGSSRAQGEVHQDVEEGVNKHDLRFVQRVLNKKLKPILEARGFNVTGGSFVFPKALENLSVEDLVNLSDIIEIPAYYVQEKFGIPQAGKDDVLARKQAPQTTIPPVTETEESEQKKDPQQKQKPQKANLSDMDRSWIERTIGRFFDFARTMGSRANLNLQDKSTIFTHTDIDLADTVDIGLNIDKLFNQALRNIYRKKGGNVPLVDESLFNISNAAYQQGIDEQFKSAGVEFGKKNQAFINEFKTNAAVFAAFKNHRQTLEISALLLDENGNLRSFYDFKKAVLGTTIKADYNQRWLLTEYNTAVRSARMAAKFKKFELVKHLYPNLEFMPSTAANPREEHKEYYGTILPIDHPWWNGHTPPIDWGCECGIRNTDKPVTAVPEDADPIDPVFDNNPGITGEIVNMKQHPYLKNIPEDVASEIRKFADEKQNSYKTIKTENGIVRLSPDHGKSEQKENIEIATYFANKYSHEIDLIPRSDVHKSADVYNHTLGYQQEYKLNKRATISAIDNAIRSGGKQADHLVIDIKSKIKTGDLENALKDRVNRAKNIKSVWIKIGKFDKQYSREDILSKGFKIKRD